MLTLPSPEIPIGIIRFWLASSGKARTIAIIGAISKRLLEAAVAPSKPQENPCGNLHFSLNFAGIRPRFCHTDLIYIVRP
jgi:hypothetical protein